MKKSIRKAMGLALVSVLTPVAMAATWTVDKTVDNPAAPPVGSLRWAINQANNDGIAPILIDFRVPAAQLQPPVAGGLVVIQPRGPLPIISNINGLGITIDGFSQSPTATAGVAPPFTIVCEVVLDGSMVPAPPMVIHPVGPYAHGLHVMSSNNTIRGLCVQNFPHDGICIQGVLPGFNGHTAGSSVNNIFYNLVGTDSTGMVAMPNGHGPGGLWGGIYVKVVPGAPGWANNNWILENLSSGNTHEGVGISNCPDEGSRVSGNHVERCHVGTEISGTTMPPNMMGNGHDGVYIGEGADNNVVEQNTICHNGYSGVGIVGYGEARPPLITHSNLVRSNSIGEDVHGNPLGNVRHGVAIGSYGGTVWGFAPSNRIIANTIAYNGLTGVAVQDDASDPLDDDTSFNLISQNSIYHNGFADPGYLGIDLLFEPGVTPNDVADGDLGPNQLINFPVITSAIFNLGVTTVSGSLVTGAPGPVTVEVFSAIPDNSGTFHGQGARYWGSTTSGGPTWSVALIGGPPPGTLVTATATDIRNNTSEFAFNVPVWDEDQSPNDLGDAPDSYGTLRASNGPEHVIVPGMYLGSSVDGERDGQPSANADGDDTDSYDDEDGVSFPVPLVPGQVAQIDVMASVVGWIDAWIDFDGNGAFHSSEQIVTSGIHPGGNTMKSWNFNVPASAVVGPTFTRVRYSSGGGLLPTGPTANGSLPDGEVEDHMLEIEGEPQEEIDWGDAPDAAGAVSYPTLASSNGARHPIRTGFHLGAGIDGESDGQPTVNADGDDNDGNDDEDGVSFPNPLVAGKPAQIDIVVTGSGGSADAWIDFAGNGNWTDAGDQILNAQALVPGLNSFTFNVPAGATPGMAYTRVRLSTVGGLPIGGAAPDGEVEDHLVQIEEPQDEFDWGDAPDPTYPTLAASGGAHHALSQLFLGMSIDAEADGQPSTSADGDDFDANDDEDGVVFPTTLVSGVPTTIQVTTSAPGILQGWIDWNADGDWADAAEQVVTDLQLPVAGTHSVTFPVPQFAGSSTYARFRISSLRGLGDRGFAPDGEVEDYAVTFDPLKWLQIPEQGAEGVDVANTDFKLADDFLCTESGEITDVHLWGSFLGDRLPPEGPGGLIFEIEIWSDVPVGADPRVQYSHPGELLWQETFAPGQYNAGRIWTVKEGEWWHDPRTGNWIPGADQNIYQFDFYPEEPFVQEQGTVYWLAVKYRYEGDAEFEFGWKTTPDAWNDDAVFFDPGNAPAFWKNLVYRNPHPWAPESLNLAFALSGHEEQERDMDFGDAPEAQLGFNYPTTLANNGARHVIAADPTGRLYQMGPSIDQEPDGQPSGPADGDDTNVLFPGIPDDEDGVTFPTAFIPNVAAAIQVNASHNGYLSVWLDIDRNGDWAAANERIFTDLPVSVGTNQIGFHLPSVAVPGTTYARFRFTSQPLPAGVDYQGPAPDGEVEDYLIRIEEPVRVDLGDAPDGPYPTLILNNGARHVIRPGMFLGKSVDGEPDGQPDPNALGDDNDILFPPVNDDEDGVWWYPLVSGQGSAMDVTASMPGLVDVWIDYNGNGSWLDPGDKVFAAMPVNAGYTQLPFTVPAGTPSITTMARVRYSGAGVPLPTGQAPDGEVEDYEVRILPEGTEVFDFGDAFDDGTPATYPTLTASGGAAHLFGGPILGALVDPEVDGQPDPAALGDDLLDASDDEDGVTFGYALIGGQPTVVEIVAAVPGRVDMWIDWGQDGSWFNLGDQVLTAHAVNPGPNYLTIPVPRVGTGPTIARVRISSMGGLPPTGYAPDGEVEDHEVFLHEEGRMDFGDAPDFTILPTTSFPTTMADFGAAHFIDSLFMGILVDGEIDGQPSMGAVADGADEDGVAFNQAWVSGSTAQVTVSSTGNAELDLWVDWDGDGTWTQSDNHVLIATPVLTGATTFSIAIPAGIGPQDTYVRFRLTHPGTGTGYGGFVHGGEVEDYMVPIGKTLNSAASLDRSTTPDSLVLTWTDDPNAGSYSVYSSTNLQAVYPHPPHWALETSSIGSGVGTWSENITIPMKFYSVIAFP